MRNHALAIVLFGAIASVAAAPPAPITLRARSIPVKGQPTHLFAHRDGLLATCFHANSLSVIDCNTRKALSLHLTSPGDSIVAKGKIFASESFGAVLVFDLKTRKEVKRLRLVGDGRFAATADGKTVFYATNTRNEFHIIDTDTYRSRKVPYPAGGRGIGSLALGPDGKRLYLGIQRRGQGPGGNSFLAVYDLAKNAYVGTVDLFRTNQFGESDDSIPAQMAFSSDGQFLHVGMMQSLAGIQVVSTRTLSRVGSIYFQPGPENKQFPWVDPLGVRVYRDWLLSVNRNNNELVIVDRTARRIVARVTFADGTQSMETIAVQDDRIYLGGRDTVQELDGRELARLLAQAMREGRAKTPPEITLKSR